MFIIPGSKDKTGDERLVILNRVATSVIDSVRGQHPDYVLVYRDDRVGTDRQDPLGHRSGRITTHYSAAELESLLQAANRVCEAGSRKTPALVVLMVLKRQAPAAVAASA